MATIIEIQQGTVRSSGVRAPIKTWYVVNTTLHDEEMLMRNAFLPILLNKQQLKSSHIAKDIKAVLKRFFGTGTFLMQDQLDTLNMALGILRLPAVKLPNDNKYFQPVMPGKFKPCKKAWTANGVARSVLMRTILEEAELGGGKLLQIDDRATLEDFISDTDR